MRMADVSDRASDGCKQMLRRLASGALLLLLSGLAGCATTPISPHPLSSAPSEEVLNSLRTIGVTAGTLPHKARLTPSTTAGEAAWVGAKEGARITFNGAIELCRGMGLKGLVACPISAVLGAVLAPVGAGVGATVEAIRAESRTTVETAPALVLKLLTEADIPGSLRDRISNVGNEWTRWGRWQFVVLPEDVPGTPERAAPALVERGVDTVLQVDVESIDLAGAGPHINPSLVLVMTVRTRLLRMPDLDVLHENSLTWESIPRRLGEWAAADGGRLREEIRQASRSLAERVVDEVFLLFPPLENFASTDARIVSERIKFLRDGTTARQEIYDRLGEPVRRYEGGRVLTYLMYEDHRGQLRSSPVPGRPWPRDREPAYGSARYRLVLMFGRDDRLEAHRLLPLDKP